MSKLVEGIKDRMVAAAREAAPAAVDAAVSPPGKAPRRQLPRKLPRQLPMPRTRQGRRPSLASSPPPLSP